MENDGDDKNGSPSQKLCDLGVFETETGPHNITLSYANIMLL